MGISRRTNLLFRENEFRTSILPKEVVFLHNMLCADNSIIVSVMRFFL